MKQDTTVADAIALWCGLTLDDEETWRDSDNKFFGYRYWSDAALAGDYLIWEPNCEHSPVAHRNFVISKVKEKKLWLDFSLKLDAYFYEEFMGYPPSTEDERRLAWVAIYSASVYSMITATNKIICDIIFEYCKDLRV